MGEPIHRDATIASEAVRYALITDAFTTKELVKALDTSLPNRTVIEVLQELEREGWVERENEESEVWISGKRTHRLRCEEVPLSYTTLCDAQGVC